MSTGLEAIADPLRFIHESGQLHDTQILHVEWDAALHRVAIHVHDLNANFVGWPEYKGEAPGWLFFDGVTFFHVTVDPANFERHIYGIDIERTAELFTARIHMSPGGILRVSFAEMSIRRLHPRSDS